MALDAASRDLEIWSEAIGLGVIDVRVSPEQKQALDSTGLNYEVSIEDLQHYIDEVFAGPEDEGFFDAYRTYDEHVAFLNDLAAQYPDLAEMVDLGSSVEGRPLWAIRITGPGTGKPGVMYHGGQHGNELTGTVVVTYMAQRLVTSYDGDPDIRSLVDNVEWFLLPIMNPDGYVGGRRYNANGADLNRDWPAPSDFTNGFSQPETTAMRDFFLANPNVRAHVDFHTYGNMIMWAWGYTKEFCEDDATFRHVGLEMQGRILGIRGTLYARLGPIYTTIYPVHGGSIDYTYGDLGLWAFTFEVGCCGYAVPTSEILATAEEIAPTMLLLAEWVSDCNGSGVLDSVEITLGEAQDCNSNDTPDECEILSDFDGDNLFDPCDDDTDNDGVLNETDECDFTPAGTPIDAVGRPISDTNGNCNVDLVDYWRFHDCFRRSGPGVQPPTNICVETFGYDDDMDVDLADFAGFATAFTGDR
jgi:hypothetical protein